MDGVGTRGTQGVADESFEGIVSLSLKHQRRRVTT